MSTLSSTLTHNVTSSGAVRGNSCSNLTQLQKDGNPVSSSLMFAAGVVGNVVALAILGIHRKELRTKTSSFCILVTCLAITDLLGTCVLSPVVFVAYSHNATLLGLLNGKDWLCHLFAFVMMYASLTAMMILCAMAVERCLAISYPYFYSQHNIRTWIKRLLPAIYVASGLFCALPFLGFGKYKQYCPGTWCFVMMMVDKEQDLHGEAAFSLSYATLIALLILVIFICNGLVIISLCQMYRKQQARRRGSINLAQRRRKSWFVRGEEEVDHLILLALMTVIFVICSLPLSVRAFVGAIAPDHKEDADMLAFRLSALNPIVDPWLFIIFRNTVFRSLKNLFCCHLGWPCWPRAWKAAPILQTPVDIIQHDHSAC